MEKKESRVGNYLPSSLFIALGIVMLVTMKVGNYELMSTYSLGAGFFPLWIAIFMIAIGGLLIWFTHKGVYDKEKKVLPGAESFKKLAVMVLATVIGVMLIEKIGMVLTIACYFFSVSKFVCGKAWKESVLSSLIAAAAIYVVFKVGFKVKFPVGMFGI